MSQQRVPLRVLYIEDWESDADLVTLALKRAGYDVTSQRVVTAEAMAAALRDAAWDVIISDYRLPDFDAPSALAVLQQSGLDLPFLIMSGTIEEAQAVTALRAGAHDFITKGNLARLAPAIERELREAENRRRQRQAELQLRFQAHLLDTVGRAVIATDLAGTITYWNRFAETLYGWPASEAVGRPILDVTSTSATRAEAAAILERLRAGESWSGEFVVRRRDGTEFPALVTDTPIYDERGQLTGIVGVSIDISERKQTEVALAQSERRFRALIENSADGIILTDRTGLVTYTSPATARIVGGAPGDWLGGYFQNRVHPDDAALVNERWGRLVQVPGASANAVFRYRRQDDTWGWLEATGTNLLDEPAVQAVVINYRDITERLQSEAAQKQSEALFRALFELLPDAVVLIDPYLADISWPIVDCNLAACRMNGYERHELIGQSVDVLNLTPGTAAERQEYFQRLRQAATLTFETYHRRKDGQEFPVEVSTSLIHIGERELIIGIDRDITERRRAELALQAAEAKYRTLIEQVPAIIYVAALDKSSSTLYISPQIEKLGYTAADHLADPKLWAQVIHPDDRERVLTRVAQTTDSLEPLSAEYRIRDRQGREYWVRDEAVVVRDAAGRPLVLQGVMLDITEGKQAEAQIQRQVERLAALRAIDLAITGSLDLRLTLDVFLEQVLSQLGVHAADILLFNPQEHSLAYAAGRGFRSSAFQQTRVLLGEGRAGRAALERRIISETSPVPAYPPSQRTGLLGRDQFVSYFGVPLLAKGQLLGVLEIFHRAVLQPDPAWLEFLESLAGQAAIALENATLFDGLQRSHQNLTRAYDATIEGWSRALDLRDKETEGHSQRVTDLTLRLARAMHMREEELVHVRRGALLHDIGKMGIPDRILLKPEGLTSDEWVIMRQHPTFAHELLSPITFLRPALEIPHCHHEKWDGTGYPRGLQGEQIPLAARLFAVVDVWDALCSDRPYRPAWPRERVLEHIRSLSGSHFDPRAVEAFLPLLGA